jgi:hypothetical protein
VSITAGLVKNIAESINEREFLPLIYFILTRAGIRVPKRNGLRDLQKAGHTLKIP